MRIQVKGRTGFSVDDELRARVEKKLAKVARQVSPLAELEVELTEERNPPIRDSRSPRPRSTSRASRCAPASPPPTWATRSTCVADDLARQVKRHRDKRRGRREAATRVGRSERAGVEQPDAAPANASRPRSRCYLARDDHPRARPARRRGQEVQGVREARRPHQRLRARARARADDELRERYDALRERALSGESLDDLLPEAFALTREAAQAHARPAPLRRPADRRHGPARRLDRRDEDRRGQDPHRHAAVFLNSLARRQGRPPGHGQRLPRPPRRRVDEADLRPARRDRRR